MLATFRSLLFPENLNGDTIADLLTLNIIFQQHGCHTHTNLLSGELIKRNHQEQLFHFWFKRFLFVPNYVSMVVGFRFTSSMHVFNVRFVKWLLGFRVNFYFRSWKHIVDFHICTECGLHDVILSGVYLLFFFVVSLRVFLSTVWTSSFSLYCVGHHVIWYFLWCYYKGLRRIVVVRLCI